MYHAKVISARIYAPAPGAATFVAVATPFFIALLSAVYLEQGRTDASAGPAPAMTTSTSGAPAAPGSAYGFGIGFE
jgi:hypothetical protein